jgi:hypothetical protein
MQKLVVFLFLAVLSSASAQDEFLDAEFESFDDFVPQEETVVSTPEPANPPPPPSPSPTQLQPALPVEQAVQAVEEPVYVRPPPKHVTVEEEMRTQREILARKQQGESTIGSSPEINRYPQDPPLFKKPKGPAQGGVVRTPHPGAAQGLLRINKDGSYQYRTKLRAKSASGSFSVGMITPPKIKAKEGDVTFESMYGNNTLTTALFAYEWQPFRGFGALGLQLGLGLTSTTAKGRFQISDSSRPAQSRESYNLFIVPLSAFLNYRFEYLRKQWVVPFVSGGVTYYGLAEVRNDGKSPVFAGAPAAGGGGGLLISISRWDVGGSFSLSEEYGIADMWLMVQARAMQGLNTATDFTNQTVDVGIAVDF